MKRQLILAIIAIMTGVTDMSAQTVQWAVRPTSAQIEDYGDLLKIRKNGKCGLINKGSETIVPTAYDSISPFRDGYAFAMNRQGKSFKIEAVISDGDYELQPVTETVYATRYLWFSDGKMPVKGDGGWGYLGPDGNMAIPCQFQQAFPFSEGYASVIINDKAYYVNRYMDYLNVEAGYGDLIFASTFYGGEAVVFSKNRKGYVINKQGRTLRTYKEKAENLKVNRIDHSVGDRAAAFKTQVAQLHSDPSYTVFKENGKYGYKKGNAIVLPAQLDKAEPVCGGYANVTFGNQNGILRFVDGSFSLQLENQRVDVSADNAGRNFLQLNVPKELEDANLKLRITDQQGHQYLVQATNTVGEHRTFSFRPADTPADSKLSQCTAAVWGENLLLWSTDFEVSYNVAPAPKEEVKAVPKEEKPQPKLSIASMSLSAPRPGSKRANPKNDFFVTVQVSNSGDERGDALVTLFLNNKKMDTKLVSVKGHASASAIFKIPDVRKEYYAKAKAMLKNGRYSQEAEILFKPFY